MIASLVYLGTSFFCGGTIVTQRHVVTAAHCDLRLLEYAKDVDSMGVYVGVNKVKGGNFIFNTILFYYHSLITYFHHYLEPIKSSEHSV